MLVTIVTFALCFKTTSSLSQSRLQQISQSFIQEETLLCVLPPSNYFGRISYMITSDKSSELAFLTFFSSHMKVEVATNIVTPPITNFDLSQRRRQAYSVIVFTAGNDSSDVISEFSLSERWHSDARVLIVLLQGYKELANELISLLWKKRKAINVTVLISGGKKYSLHTIFPYSSGEIVELSFNRHIFPNKIVKNFNSYPITAAVTAAEPYILNPQIPNEYTDGVEIRVLKSFASHLNFSLKYATADRPWVFMDANRTVSGLFGLLHRREADILCHGAPRSFERVQLGDPLMSHYEDSVHWIMPLMKAEQSNIVILESFTYDLWIGIGLTWIVMSVLLFIFWRVSNKFTINVTKITLQECLFKALALNIYVGIFVPSNNAIRFLLAVFYLYVTNTTMAYQSLLYKLYSRPSVAVQLETARQAVDYGLVAFLYPSGRPTYNQTDHDTWNIILQPGKHNFTDEYVNTLSVMRHNRTNFAQLVKATAMYEISKNHLDLNKNPLIHIVQQRVLPFSPTFYMSRGHPLKNLFNNMVHHLVEAGLIQHWLDQFIVLGGRFEVSEPSSLNIHQTQVSFIMLMVLDVLALFAFMGEALVARLTKKNRKSNMEELCERNFKFHYDFNLFLKRKRLNPHLKRHG